MADIVSTTELQNASLDCESLSKCINGSETLNGTGLVTTREGTVVQTLKKVVTDLANMDIGESAAALINARLDDLEARVSALEP